ncbi:hypothetical protein YB2330_000417 [Saitoella coloradoensis]
MSNIAEQASTAAMPCSPVPLYESEEAMPSVPLPAYCPDKLPTYAYAERTEILSQKAEYQGGLDLPKQSRTLSQKLFMRGFLLPGPIWLVAAYLFLLHPYIAASSGPYKLQPAPVLPYSFRDSFASSINSVLKDLDKDVEVARKKEEKRWGWYSLWAFTVVAVVVCSVVIVGQQTGWAFGLTQGSSGHIRPVIVV